MKAIVGRMRVDIYPTDEEVKEFCKVGRGADTCVWLLVAPTGWSCAALNRPPALIDRLRSGNIVAKRDGCEKVNNFNPSGLSGKVNF